MSSTPPKASCIRSSRVVVERRPGAARPPGLVTYATGRSRSTIGPGCDNWGRFCDNGLQEMKTLALPFQVRAYPAAETACAFLTQDHCIAWLVAPAWASQ